MWDCLLWPSIDRLLNAIQSPNYNNKIQIPGLYALSQNSQDFRQLKKVNLVILGDPLMSLVRIFLSPTASWLFLFEYPLNSQEKGKPVHDFKPCIQRIWRSILKNKASGWIPWSYWFKKSSKGALRGGLSPAQDPLTVWPHCHHPGCPRGDRAPGSCANTCIKMSQPKSHHPEPSHTPELLQQLPDVQFISFLKRLVDPN